MDWNWVTVLVGVTLMGITAFVAYGIGAYDATPMKPYVEKKPICGCTHHFCFHEAGGKCGHNHYGNKCGCVQYVGPEPLPEFTPSDG